MKKIIPTYDLNGTSGHGILVKRMSDPVEHPTEDFFDKGVHRDSHYIFTFLQGGHVQMMVDFNIIEADKPAIFCVLPGQVHQGLLMRGVAGWFVGVKMELVPDFVRSVFEESLVQIKPLYVDEIFASRLNACAEVLQDSCADEKLLLSKDGLFVVQSLLNAFTGMFAQYFTRESKSAVFKESRAVHLVRQFRTLVRNDFKTLKRPSSYAGILNISPGYLTEVVREVTGKSALYWIQQEILIEAKRLLFFTHLTAKEIAYELGYNDHAYFSRLFSRLEGCSPLDFRDQSRKQK